MPKQLPAVSVWAAQYVHDERDDDPIDEAPMQTAPPVAVSVGLIAQFALGAVVAMVAASLPVIAALPLFIAAFAVIRSAWKRYRAMQ